MLLGDKLSELLSLRDVEELRKEVEEMSEQDAKNTLLALLTAWNRVRAEKEQRM